MLDEDPERPSPVADVVLAHHLVAEERQHADQRVADDRAAHVADVQLLGHVRRRVVDEAPAAGRRRDTEPGISGRLGEHAAEQRGIDDQVDEARPGDLRDGDTVEVGGGDDVGSHVAGVATESLGEGQCPVGLRIGAVRWPHDGVDVLARDGRERRSKPLGEHCEEVGHRATIVACASP